MIDKKAIYAVAGASNNQQKYGYKVLQDLKDSGYQVIPINPHEKEILALKVYKSLEDAEIKIDTVIFVVPPTVTEKILFEVKKLQIKNVWLQPGSKSRKAIQYCKDNNINCIYDACIMISSKK